MIDELKKNIETEIDILREIAGYIRRRESAQYEERKLLEGAINSLVDGLKIINENIPEVLKGISVAAKLGNRKNLALEKITYVGEKQSVEVTLNPKDRVRFLRELNIGESFVKKLKKRETEEKEKYEEFKASRGYLKIANKFFLSAAVKNAKGNMFKNLKEGLRKANMEILFESYIAMMYLTTVLAFFASVIAMLFFVFFTVTSAWPFLELRTDGFFLAALKFILIPIIVPTLTFLALYFYPTTEKQSIGSRIDQELPFAVIHMSAITGSGIAPTEIFRIIGLSHEYPFLRKEIRKVLNQINLYGYDLTTALVNASKTASSEKLAELFSGLATSINSGTDLSEFFQKRAESLLLTYRLEREKYTKLVETFLDIYISIVITAPMVFLLMIVMMAISGLNIGLGPFQISLLSVAAIAVLNIVFLVFLHLRQPSY